MMFQEQPISPQLATSMSATWHSGDVILGQYEVLDVLGEGGMGTVYKVHHRGWNVDLAVKSPRPDVLIHAGGEETFRREAETWVNLNLHPHVVSCYYVRTVDEVPRVFAEYVAGGSLSDWIRTRKLYEGGYEKALERMLDVAIQFAWGLDYAHEQGLVHQDVKPANVMMTLDGIAKVSDFGLAQARMMTSEATTNDHRDQSVVVPGMGLMTRAYASPEQMRQQPLTRKTDIWSWGVSVLEMFVGEVTWQIGGIAREVLAIHESQDTAIPLMPADLVKLLARCFEPRPEVRPATMREVAQTLQQIYAHGIGRLYLRVLPRSMTMQADTLNNRALSLYDLGKVEEAKQVWQQALQADPQHLEATYNRGVVLWRQGELTDEAFVQALETCRGETPVQQWMGTSLLAQVHLERGDREAALPLLKEGACQTPEQREERELLKRVQAGSLAFLRRQHVLRETHEVGSVSLSADGRWLASGSLGGAISLWETASGRCVRILQGHLGVVEAVSLSVDGRFIASGGNDGTVRLWETASGRCIRILQEHTGPVDSVSLSANGRWVTSGAHPYSGDRTGRLWEVASGRCVRTFEECVSPLTLSADGNFIASGSLDETIRLWETATGRCSRILRGHKSSVNSVSLSADGRWLASGSSDYTVRLWETASGRCIHTLQEHTDEVLAVSLNRDGVWLASGSADKTLKLWKRGDTPRFSCAFHLSLLRTFTEVAQTKTHAETLLEEAERARAAGRFAIALGFLRELRSLPGWERNPQSLRAWEMLALSCERPGFRAAWKVRDVQETGDWVTSVSLSTDGKWLVSGSLDETIRLWETATGRCVHILQGHTDSINAVRLSADGRFIVSGSSDKTVRKWEIASGRCLHVLKGHNSLVSAVDLSADGTFVASGSWDNTIRLWEMASGNCMSTLQGHAGYIDAVSLSADGNWLVSGSWDKTVRLWETSTGRYMSTLQGDAEHVEAVSLSADGYQLAFCNRKGIISLWKMDWEITAHDPADWDEGARPYLESFLAQHTPSAGTLPQDREPTEQEIQQALTHQGTPTWNEEDFRRLTRQLQYVGYGWLRPEGVRHKLEEMSTSAISNRKTCS